MTGVGLLDPGVTLTQSPVELCVQLRNPQLERCHLILELQDPPNSLEVEPLVLREPLDLLQSADVRG
jgi:hypothetical protein